jgi:7-cyano-7-deazaguanine synthase
LKNYDEVFAITFSYGQKHVVELESARKIASLANVEHEVLELGAIFAGLSSLTDATQTIPEGESNSGGLPSTFVPGRNILFLSLAGSRAYVRDCEAIITGVSQEDFAGYPDCRAEFIASMENALTSGLDRKVAIVTPLMHLSKAETVELARTLPGCMEALSFSTTCYNGAVPPCGSCNSCQLRAKGFAGAGVADPLIERLSGERENSVAKRESPPAKKVVADAGR